MDCVGAVYDTEITAISDFVRGKFVLWAMTSSAACGRGGGINREAAKKFFKQSFPNLSPIPSAASMRKWMNNLATHLLPEDLALASPELLYRAETESIIV